MKIEFSFELTRTVTTGKGNKEKDYYAVIAFNDI